MQLTQGLELNWLENALSAQLAAFDGQRFECQDSLTLREGAKVRTLALDADEESLPRKADYSSRWQRTIVSERPTICPELGFVAGNLPDPVCEDFAGGLSLGRF